MDVSAIMTRTVVTVTPRDPVRRAAELLEDLEIRHLPVVDEGRLVGVVSDRDLREYRLPLDDELEDPEYADALMATPIEEMMNRQVISLEPTESLTTAVDLILEYGIGAIPVVDKTGRLEGILSYVDILKALRPSLD
jgi:acetoin utilization protein AcuB